MTVCIDALKTQGVYRVLLEAMSHPGRLLTLPETRKPYKKHTSLFLVLGTLLDHEVSVSVISHNGGKALEEQIVMMTKAHPVKLPKADYVIVKGANSFGKILEAKRGTLEFPDGGATALYLIDPDTTPTEGVNSVSLQGPGIPPDVQSVPEMNFIDTEELARIKQINAEFPLGVDCIFLTEEAEVMCIPRSTQIVMNVIPWAM
jgi:phosphonate C-P lyase system protein PhnH